MALALRTTLAATLAASAAADSFAGYLADIYCVQMCSPDQPRCSVLDGTDMMRQPETHTVHCLADVPQCYESGFCLLTQQWPEPTPNDPDPSPIYKCSVYLDQEMTQSVVLPYLEQLRPNGQDANVWVTVNGHLMPAESFQDRSDLTSNCQLCQGPQLRGMLTEFTIVPTCDLNNGGCPSDQQCVEEPMMCFNPPCPTEIRCVGQTGGVLLFDWSDDENQGGLNSVRWSPTGAWIATIGDNGVTRAWEPETGTQMMEHSDCPHPQTDQCKGLALAWVDQMILSGGSWMNDLDQNTIPLWGHSPAGTETMQTYTLPRGLQCQGRQHTGQIATNPWVPMGGGGIVPPIPVPNQAKYLTTHCGGVAVRDDSGNSFGTFPVPGQTNDAQFVSTDRMVVATDDGAMIASLGEQPTMEMHLNCQSVGCAGPVSQARVNPEGQVIALCMDAAGGEEAYVNFFTVEGEFVGAINDLESGTKCTALSWDPMGIYLAVGQSGVPGTSFGAPVLRVYDTSNMWRDQNSNGPQFRLNTTFDGHTGDINEIDWSPDSTKLASVSEDGTAKVWQFSNFRPEPPRFTHLPPVDPRPPAPPGPGPQPPMPPPRPGIPTEVPVRPPLGGGCFDVLSQTCPSDNQDLCQSCVSSLGFILRRAGCTDTDYAEYCIASKTCTQVLEEGGCISSNGATPESCMTCASRIEGQLLQHECTSDMVNTECKRGTQYDPVACQSALGQYCPELAGQGEACEACVVAEVNALSNSGCSYNTTSTYCQSSTGTTSCDDVLRQYCQNSFQQGNECFSCLSRNQAPLRRVCQNLQLQEFCTPEQGPPPETPPTCMDKLQQECPRGDPTTGTPSDQPTCLRCISQNLNQLMQQAGCSREDAVNWCIA